MAMVDNLAFNIPHLRNSFITSDDTTMCELIIDTDDYNRSDKHQSTPSRDNHRHHGRSTYHRNSDSGLDSFDADLSSSLDIFPDMEFGHRRRSNTAQRLDKLKKEKRSQCKVKTVTWKTPSTPISGEEAKELFGGKELEDVGAVAVATPKTSLLSQQLVEALEQADNPFMEYAKFDGSSSVGMSTKRVEVYLTMAPQEERYRPIPVVVANNARVHDIIGFICYQYTREERTPKLKPLVEMYCLRIAEDDGEVEPDLPSLDNREPFNKFGFPKVALVERDEGSFTAQPSSVIVTVYAPSRGFNKLQVANTDITMRDILEKIMKKRRLQSRLGLSYKLEKQQEPGSTVDLDSSLSSQNTLEFCLIRENSARGDMEEFERRPSVTDAYDMSIHQYKSFIVSLPHRLFRSSVDVQLGIGGDKFEIDPAPSKGIFSRKRVITAVSNVVECVRHEVHKSSGRATFRITHLCGDDYKKEVFESDIDTVNEIVAKVNRIIEYKDCPARKEFLEYMNNKKLRKRESVKYT